MWFEGAVKSSIPTEPNDVFKQIVQKRLVDDGVAGEAARARWAADIEAHRGAAGKLGFGWGEALNLAVATLLWTMPKADLLTGGSESGAREGICIRYLVDNSLWALHARESYPWAKALSWPGFLRSVLPYSILCEGRGEWREAFHSASDRCWSADDRLSELLKEAAAAPPQLKESKLDAAVHRLVTLVRRNITGSFGQPGVVTVTDGYLAPFQSPFETLDYGSGRSGSMQLFVLYALRAAGIACRLVVEIPVDDADVAQAKGIDADGGLVPNACCREPNPQFYTIDARRPFRRARGAEGLPEGIPRTKCCISRARCQYLLPCSEEWIDFEAVGWPESVTVVRNIDFGCCGEEGPSM